MDVEFKLEGFKELDALLTQLPDEIAKKVVEQTVRAGAKVVLDAAKLKVPVRTGRLKKSLSIKKNTAAFKNYGSVKYAVGANLSARKGTTAPHAHLVEFGTVKTAAKPFLRPALEENREKVFSVFRSMLWTGIEREAGILAGRYRTVRRR